MQTATDDMLRNQVAGIVAALEETDNSWKDECEDPDYASAFDYIADCLDIEYIVSGDGTYRGARILVAFGGPNVWINTQRNIVEGYWWNDSCTMSFDDNMCLDETMEELWNCK